MANTSNVNSTAVNDSSVPSVAVVTATWLLLPIAAAATFVNGVALIAFISDRSLWTPFNYYLGNLAFCDIIIGSVDVIFYFVSNYCGYWPLGRALCHIWLYIDWVVTIAVAYSMMLISLDRLWAITYPVAYRTYHSKRLSFLAILSSWFLINLLILPGFVQERVVAIDAPLQCSQDLGSHKAWTLASQFIGYYLPHFCIIASYLVIGFRLKKSQTVVDAKRKRITMVLSVVTPGAETTQAVNLHSREPLTYADEKKANGTTERQQSAPVDSRADRSSERKPIRLLGSLVLCFTLCWTPSYVYFSLITFGMSYDNNTFISFSYLLSFINSVVNPLLYHAGSQDFRRATNKLRERVRC